ncbi:unnamed protein product [Clonostachys solani]|uniref:Major facilitator superfamily (MFS) profile domain-containing protein n=1 Tax=Clonostachys solani TaxID=160281 RepID=A0A9P0EMS9_9HYPO|nr:unnamed protein product [Clonostachys solani]
MAFTNADLKQQDPQNMSRTKKWAITCVLSHASLCVTCFSSIYTTTYEKMEAELGNDRILSVLGLSTFVLGLAFGPTLFGPLSEIYGRRPIYLTSWVAYLIFLIPPIVTESIFSIIACRFLNGFFGSAFLTVSGGTIRDIFSGEELQTPMALFSASQFMGPGLGPLLGGFINFHSDWRWTYYTVIIWSSAAALITFISVPETYCKFPCSLLHYMLPVTDIALAHQIMCY